jgi:hypothetical protein
MNRAAIVTLVVGDRYFLDWQKYSEPSWRAYAQKHQLDLIVLKDPLDRSPRAAARSPAWQKCLIPSQPFAQQYEQLVLLDSDIAINSAEAPNVCELVPPDRIGGVLSGSHVQEDLRAVLLTRLGRRSSSYRRAAEAWREDQGRGYLPYGLNPLDAGIVQTGVLVLNGPRHAELFRIIYDSNYPLETRTYEQIPLSHAMLTAGLFQEIDTRFNSVFFESMLVHFPYLLDRSRPDHEHLARLYVRAEYGNNFFLHFAYDRQFIRYLAG